MGQRHQIFIRVLNPLHVCKKATKETIKMFGLEKYTVLAFHNQWLYGRSAPQCALNMLNFAAQFPKEWKSDKEAWDGYDSPLTYKGIDHNFSDIDLWVKTIQFILNFRPTNTEWLSAGIWHTYFLNKDQPGMREDFRDGDNNDGITIIDTIENKYCFMNIYDQTPTGAELANSVRDLPTLTPCTAAQYIRAYYGETLKTVNSYHIDPERLKEGRTPKTVLADHKRINRKLIKQFEPYQLLTVEEVAAIFPKVKEAVEANQPAYE